MAEVEISWKAFSRNHYLGCKAVGIVVRRKVLGSGCLSSNPGSASDHLREFCFSFLVYKTEMQTAPPGLVQPGSSECVLESGRGVQARRTAKRSCCTLGREGGEQGRLAMPFKAFNFSSASWCIFKMREKKMAKSAQIKEERRQNVFQSILIKPLSVLISRKNISVRCTLIRKY